MIPNKPSVIVAPNGSGKSSFAFAFQWLNRLRMKLNKDDAYMGDENNKPSMTSMASNARMPCLVEILSIIQKRYGKFHSLKSNILLPYYHK